MQRCQTLPLKASCRGAAVAIGNFDGVHLGHQSILSQTKAVAGACPFGVLTFEPHPRQYFSQLSGQSAQPFRLMTADGRANRLEKLGLDVAIELAFDANLAALRPDDFCREILSKELGLAHVVVGADFQFGQGRSGNVATLTQLGADLGFGVTVAKLAQHGDQVISSTNIRNALSEGNPHHAAAMLGHWHRIEGEVLHGEKRGRELGYPTANMSIADLHPPAFGVYAVTVDVLSGDHQGTYQGAASIGVRPMFGENSANCETFLFDFSGDLYGETLSVGLVEFLRPEAKFEGLPELINQMEQDCIKARRILDEL